MLKLGLLNKITSSDNGDLLNLYRLSPVDRTVNRTGHLVS